MAVIVRRLAPADDRSSFRSGNIDLDRFFARYAGQNQFRHHIGTTYVAVEDVGGRIKGFATVAALGADRGRAPPIEAKALAHLPTPCAPPGASRGG